MAETDEPKPKFTDLELENLEALVRKFERGGQEAVVGRDEGAVKLRKLFTEPVAQDDLQSTPRFPSPAADLVNAEGAAGPGASAAKTQSIFTKLEAARILAQARGQTARRSGKPKQE